jgi:hypothetical protein
MKTLKQGSRGADVKRWQLFLLGQGLEPGPADGVFGPSTHKATMQFQARYRLVPDGVVGQKTLGQAMLLGFEAVRPPATPDKDKQGANWPPRPSFNPITSNAERQRLFGKYRFASAPVAGNRENIRILDDWEEKNIVRVPIPQLKGVAGAPRNGEVRFHRLAAEQLQALWQAWENAGLLPLILTWDGSFVPRFVRGSRTVLSNHAFGSAFDINAAWNGLGVRPPLVGKIGTVRELVPLANKHGFFWGGHYKNRLDGMHFEIARIL